MGNDATCKEEHFEVTSYPKRFDLHFPSFYLLKEQTYMQKTCDVAEKAILAKKRFAEKVRKSRQNVNRDKGA